MPANIRITRPAEDVALELVLLTRGTEYEQMMRTNQRYVRVLSGVLRLIESLARDGMIAGNALSEYGDVVPLFASPVRDDDNDEAA